MPIYYLDGYKFVAPSKREGKKYDVYKGDKKLASFGATGYSQYKDRLGYYSEYNHLDKARRARYRKRHAGENQRKESAGWFAWKYLW